MSSTDFPLAAVLVMGYRHVLWVLDMPDPGPCACIALRNEPSSLYGVIQPNRAPSNSLCELELWPYLLLSLLAMEIG